MYSRKDDETSAVAAAAAETTTTTNANPKTRNESYIIVDVVAVVDHGVSITVILVARAVSHRRHAGRENMLGRDGKVVRKQRRTDRGTAQLRRIDGDGHDDDQHDDGVVP